MVAAQWHLWLPAVQEEGDAAFAVDEDDGDGNEEDGAGGPSMPRAWPIAHIRSVWVESCLGGAASGERDVGKPKEQRTRERGEETRHN